MLKVLKTAKSNTLKSRRDTMSTKNWKCAVQARQVLANHIVFGFNRKELVISAEQNNDGIDKMSRFVLGLSGGMSQKATIRRLRLIIAYLKGKVCRRRRWSILCRWTTSWAKSAYLRPAYNNTALEVVQAVVGREIRRPITASHSDCAVIENIKLLTKFSDGAARHEVNGAGAQRSPTQLQIPQSFGTGNFERTSSTAVVAVNAVAGTACSRWQSNGSALHF